MKILIIQQKMIGDVLTSSILFEALREKYPEAELHYLIYPHTRAVVENNPFVDQVIEYDPDNGKAPIKFLKFLEFIRKQSYSQVIDIYSKISSGIIAQYSGAPVRIGFQKKYTQLFYTHTFTYKEKSETKAGLAIENRLQLLQALNEDFPTQAKPKIYIPQDEKEAFRKKLNIQGVNFEHPLIMCGVLGSSNLKSYPENFMGRLLDEIVLRWPKSQILFNYLPEQKNDAELIFKKCKPHTRGRILFNIYESSLKGFMMNCANCDLYFGNEGGAANIMKALNKPTFSIHSPLVKKEYWAIYEDRQKNFSVHLEDFHPEYFQDLPSKISHKTNTALYQKFTPELVSPNLSNFLKNTII